jgi:pilus assembly protein Flp/PilA
MRALLATVRRALSEDRGASVVEYALLVALIALVVVGALTMLGTSTSTKLDQAAQSLKAS